LPIDFFFFVSTEITASPAHGHSQFSFVAGFGRCDGQFLKLPAAQHDQAGRLAEREVLEPAVKIVDAADGFPRPRVLRRR
jgi:hypothetical protein